MGLIRDLVHIRFGRINVGRLGHLAGDTALYLAEKKTDYTKITLVYFILVILVVTSI